MEENKKQTNVIDLTLLAKKIWNQKKLFYKVLPITFVVSCIYILGFPRYYKTDAKIAPEIENSTASSSLGSIASSFGFDLGEAPGSDAISPMLYPDLMEDNGFVTGLFNIQVSTQDGEISTTYYDYLKSHQKVCIWSYPLIWLKNLLPKDNQDTVGGGEEEFNPYILSKPDDDVAETIRANINFSIDKKTGVITISTQAQDPLVCKTITDSTMVHLQDFITKYRTNKARIDLEYYEKLNNETKTEYENVRQLYASSADANTNITLRSFEMKLEDIENDMQLKFNAYTTMNAQLENAKAKVQECTPAFTILKGAAMPVKAAGPKRMIFVGGMLFMAFVITSFWIVRKDLHFQF